MFHQVAHWFKWNGGNSSTFWVGDALVTCFVCATCGKRDGCVFRNPSDGPLQNVPKSSPIHRLRGEG